MKKKLLNEEQAKVVIEDLLKCGLIKPGDSFKIVATPVQENEVAETYKDPTTMMPAVTFEPHSIYTLNGPYGYDPGIDETLYSIGSYCYDTCPKDSIFKPHIGKNLNELRYQILVERFRNSLIGAIELFELKMQDLFVDDKGNTQYELTMRTPIGFLPCYIMEDAVMGYFEIAHEEQVAEVNDMAVLNWALSYVHTVGATIYNYVLNNVTSASQKFNISNKDMDDLMAAINGHFSRLMCDMSFECHVFASNIKSLL